MQFYMIQSIFIFILYTHTHTHIYQLDIDTNGGFLWYLLEINIQTKISYHKKYIFEIFDLVFCAENKRKKT